MKLLLFLTLSASLLWAAGEKTMPENKGENNQASESARAREAGNWLGMQLEKIEALKPGQSTRAELMKLFFPQGGLSTREKASFVYRSCPAIKIDAEFEVVNKDDEKTDVIKSLSKPYLDSTMIAD